MFQLQCFVFGFWFGFFFYIGCLFIMQNIYSGGAKKIHDVGITLVSLFDCLPGRVLNWCPHSVLPLYIPPIAKVNFINVLYILNSPESGLD